MSTLALPVHIALVDETGVIHPQDLAVCAGDLNLQIQRDFAPIWKVAATVGAYPAAPPATWAVKIRKQLDQPDALGYHTDELNQPVAYVAMSDQWTVTASHEILEMLADPSGNRLQGGLLPAALAAQFTQFGLSNPSDQVSYLLEVCDPPEAMSYRVGSTRVSDFITPDWYDQAPLSRPGSYSQAGGCASPRTVAPGGYVSFTNPATGQWYQAFNQAGQLTTTPLGARRVNELGSLREWADRRARRHRTARA